MRIITAGIGPAKNIFAVLGLGEAGKGEFIKTENRKRSFTCPLPG